MSAIFSKSIWSVTTLRDPSVTLASMKIEHSVRNEFIILNPASVLELLDAKYYKCADVNIQNEESGLRHVVPASRKAVIITPICSLDMTRFMAMCRVEPIFFSLENVLIKQLNADLQFYDASRILNAAKSINRPINPHCRQSTHLHHRCQIP